MNREEFLKNAEEILELGTKFVEAVEAMQNKYEEFDEEISEWEDEGDERFDSINIKLEELMEKLSIIY